MPTPATAQRIGRSTSYVVGGRAVHAWRAGPPDVRGAPLVVLVHGLVSSSRYMMPLLRRLAPDTPVAAVDLPGFGRSEDPTRALTVEELGDALAGWLEAAAAVPAVLVANSFGCQVAVEAAVRHPRLVDRLVLLGPTMDPAARTAFAQARRWLRNAVWERPSHALLLCRDLRDCGLRRSRQSFRFALDHRLDSRLPAVSADTLVVRGERDRIVSQAWAEEVARLAGASLTVIPRASHAANYQAPQAFAEVVLRFLHETAGDGEPS